MKTSTVHSLAGRWIQNRWITSFILLLVAAGGLFLDLGGRQFTTQDEGRFAEIGREIYVSTHPVDWVVQKLNGEVYGSKPPLYSALIALSYKIWGGASELAACFPSAFFGFLTLIICFFFWRRIFGLALAFISTVMLATSYKFIDQGRTVQVDMVLLFFTTASLLCAFLYMEEEKPRARWALLFFLMAVFATLTKGPVGLLLPSLVVGVYGIWNKKWSRLFSAPVGAGLALYLILIGAWVLYLYRQAGALYLYEIFFRENLLRYVDAYDHQESFFYYFPAFLIDFLPWSPFLLLALTLRSWRKNETGKSLSFFWIWFAVIFIFFTLSGAKRGQYLLPLYPAACLLVGNGWKNQGAKWAAPLFAFALVFTVSCPLLLDQYYDFKEKRAGHPKEKILRVGEKIGPAPLRAYKTMKPIFQFYLGRIIPELREEKEVLQYLESEEKVYLLITSREKSSFLEQLRHQWPVVDEIQMKEDRYWVLSNKN